MGCTGEKMLWQTLPAIASEELDSHLDLCGYYKGVHDGKVEGERGTTIKSDLISHRRHCMATEGKENLEEPEIKIPEQWPKERTDNPECCGTSMLRVPYHWLCLECGNKVDVHESQFR